MSSSARVMMGDFMNTMSRWMGFTILALMLSVSLAQGDLSPAEQAIIALGNASGIAQEGDTASDVLAKLLEAGVISESLSFELELAIFKGELDTSTFTVFLADVLNGTEATPSEDDAGAFLVNAGITVPSGETVNPETIGEVLTDPNFGTAVAETYGEQASPINTSGN